MATEPTPPAAPVTTIGPRSGVRPWPLERHHRQHGGIARGADRHRLARAHARRQRHQPVALDPRLLAIGAEMGLAAAPAVEDDLVAGLPVRMAGGFHRAGEIDAGDHREAAHHRRLAGDGEAVLVVDASEYSTRTVTSPSIRLASSKSVERGLGAALRLLDHDRLECRHAPPRCFDILRRHFVARSAAQAQAVRRIKTAGAALRAGATGFSTIGRLMIADITPKNTDSHQTGLYEP